MYDWNELPQPQLVGFCDLVGVGISPVSKKKLLLSVLVYFLRNWNVNSAEEHPTVYSILGKYGFIPKKCIK